MMKKIFVLVCALLLPAVVVAQDWKWNWDYDKNINQGMSAARESFKLGGAAGMVAASGHCYTRAAAKLARDAAIAVEQCMVIDMASRLIDQRHGKANSAGPADYFAVDSVVRRVKDAHDRSRVSIDSATFVTYVQNTATTIGARLPDTP